MSVKPVCHRCGKATPLNARYCPHCGTALVPPTAPSARGINRILSGLSGFYIGFTGLVLLFLTSMFAAHLIVTGFSFMWSLVLLVVVLGYGCGYLGWHWNISVSSDGRIARVLLTFACMLIFLSILWLIDRVGLSFLTAGGGKVVYAIPGVSVEASVEGRRLVIVDVPPYWLAVIAYAMVTAAIGNLVHRIQGRSLI